MSLLTAILIFIGIPVAYVVWMMWTVTNCDAQILHDESMQLPESVVCYRRVFFALTFVLVGGGIALVGSALVYALAFSDAAADDSMVLRSGLAMAGALMCAGGLYATICYCRDLVFYTRLSPWARPILEFSHTGFRAFGGAEISWKGIAKIGTYTVNGRGQTFDWLVLVGDPACPECPKFGGRKQVYSELMAKGIARRWKIPANCFCAIPIYGTSIDQGTIAILAERYWSEATGRTYKPYSVELCYASR